MKLLLLCLLIGIAAAATPTPQPVVPPSCTYFAGVNDGATIFPGAPRPLNLNTAQIAVLSDGVTFTGQFNFSVLPQGGLVLNLLGGFGCSIGSTENKLLINILDCSATGTVGVGNICEWGMDRIAGEYPFSIRTITSGKISLIIPKWMGQTNPLEFLSTTTAGNGATCPFNFYCSSKK